MSNWTQSGYDPSQHSFRKGEIDGLNNGGYASNYFFADSLEAADIAVGSFFNNIHIYHFTKEGENKKEIEMPIKYGPRTKAFDYRVVAETGEKYYIPLPNLTYQRTNMEWASERASGKGETRTFYSKYFDKNGVDYKMSEKFWKDVQPVPYDLTYELCAHFEYRHDANQFQEQLLARFNPECYINVKEFWFANIRRSLKLKLTSVSQDVNVDYNEEDKREITITANFTLEAWLYLPIETGAIIDKIVTTLEAAQANTTHKWQSTIVGDYDGSFTNRYDLQEFMGTKIGRVSAVIPDSTIPTNMYDGKMLTSYSAKYEYEETPDVTNYPWGAKQLYGVSAIMDPDKEIYGTLVNSAGPIPSACSGMVTSVDAKYGFLYDVNWVNSWTTVKTWKDLSGYGDFAPTGTYHMGTKYADLGTEIVENAPWVATAGIINQDK